MFALVRNVVAITQPCRSEVTNMARKRISCGPRSTQARPAVMNYQVS